MNVLVLLRGVLSFFLVQFSAGVAFASASDYQCPLLFATPNFHFFVSLLGGHILQSGQAPLLLGLVPSSAAYDVHARRVQGSTGLPTAVELSQLLEFPIGAMGLPPAIRSGLMQMGVGRAADLIRFSEIELREHLTAEHVNQINDILDLHGLKLGMKIPLAEIVRFRKQESARLIQVLLKPAASLPLETSDFRYLKANRISRIYQIVQLKPVEVRFAFKMTLTAYDRINHAIEELGLYLGMDLSTLDIQPPLGTEAIADLGLNSEDMTVLGMLGIARIQDIIHWTPEILRKTAVKSDGYQFLSQNSSSKKNEALFQNSARLKRIENVLWNRGYLLSEGAQKDRMN